MAGFLLASPGVGSVGIEQLSRDKPRYLGDKAWHLLLDCDTKRNTVEILVLGQLSRSSSHGLAVWSSWIWFVWLLRVPARQIMDNCTNPKRQLSPWKVRENSHNLTCWYRTQKYYFSETAEQACLAALSTRTLIYFSYSLMKKKLWTICLPEYTSQQRIAFQIILLKWGEDKCGRIYRCRHFLCLLKNSCIFCTFVLLSSRIEETMEIFDL